MAEHPYYLTHEFPSGYGARGQKGQPYRDLKAYVQAKLTDEDGVLEYPNQNAATINARLPFGIVRPSTSCVSGHKRKIGDPSSRAWETQKENLRNNPIMLLQKNLRIARWNQSDHGRLVKQMYGEARNTAIRAIKKKIDLETTIQSMGNKSADEIAQQVMNTPVSKMNSNTVLYYATNCGAVYIGYTERDDEDGVEFESTRFLTQGQKSRGKNNGNHNAVLMWNPSTKKFPNNICPYEERFAHGFQPISKMDCFILGIDFVTLVDTEMTRTEGLKIEKACHYEINDLDLGTQRLHRVPGASAKKLEDWTKKRRLIFATFLPLGFFADHPDIVIVGSSDERH